MAVKLHDSLIRRGFQSAELSRVLETNTASHTMAEMAGGRIYKTHRIYELPLSSS